MFELLKEIDQKMVKLIQQASWRVLSMRNLQAGVKKTLFSHSY